MPTDQQGIPNAPRRLAAILAADIAGYSALMGSDEARTVHDLKGHQTIVLPMIGAFSGRIIDTAGDGILAEFASIVNAVECAVAIQKTMAERNSLVEQARRMQFRIGVNLGDVIYDDVRIYGDGINIAARLENVAEPGGICISRQAFDQVDGKLSLSFRTLGPQTLKNIAKPVELFAVEGFGGPSETPHRHAIEAVQRAETEGRQAEARDKPSIAVLPFRNLSGDPEQDYFADGIVEDIITALSRFRWLFVIARNSSFTYKGRVVDIHQAGRDLGVRYLVEGSIRKAASRVRIAGQLIDSASGGHIWADRYDRELDDIFAIQDDVTRSIVQALTPELTAVEITRAQQKHPTNLTAWDAYLRALPLMRMHTQQAWGEGVQLLTNAISLAPNFAAAYARLSACLTQAAYYGWGGSSSQSAAKALELARQAQSLDAEEPLAFDALASAYQFAGDNVNAEVAARRALELSPTCTAAYGTLITALAFLGRADEAIDVFALSEKTSPRDPDRSGRLMGLANAHFVGERYDAAVAAAKQFIALRPNWYGGYVNLAASLALLGRGEEAQHAAQRLLELIPHFNLARARKRPMYARAADAHRLFEGLRLAGIPE